MASISNKAFPACLTDPLVNSNCYILSSGSHAIIIDPNNASLIHGYLETHQLTPDYIILSHEHCDHVSGLNDLRKEYTCPVIGSTACSAGIQSTTLNMTRIMETYLYFKSNGTCRVSYPKFTCAPADITYDDEMTLQWKEHSLYFLSVPGHTPGSSVLIWDGVWLFSGDYFIPDEEVITRLPGGDEEVYETVAKPRLRSLPVPIQTFPGHGQPFILTEEGKIAYGL